MRDGRGTVRDGRGTVRDERGRGRGREREREREREWDMVRGKWEEGKKEYVILLKNSLCLHDGMASHLEVTFAVKELE